MKRELTYALASRSQFTCFSGRTRSSKSQPIQLANTKNKKKERSLAGDSEIPIDDDRETRRSKRFKAGNPDAVNVDESKGEVESAEVEVAKENGEGNVLKGDFKVKGKQKENQVISSVPRRFTRSALKEKEENVEELGTPTRKKMELKMSKKIGLDKMPTNLRELLETGLLEGQRVFYDYGNKGRLQGVIKGGGILCSCSGCKGSEVISASQFEKHACKVYRNASKYTCLENGKSLHEVLEVCKASALETLEEALQTVINSLSAKGPSCCSNCKGLFEQTSLANALICESCVNLKQEHAGPNVTASEKLSSKGPPIRRSVSESDKLQEKSEEKMPTKSSTPEPESSPESAADSDWSQKKTRKKILQRSSKSLPRSTKSATKCTSLQKSRSKKLTIKNQQLHWLVFDEGGLPDGTELTYVSHGKKLLTGYKKGHRIFCYCCNTEVSASQFEAHAGWASRKKPYENIYTSNGVSLHEYAVTLQKNSRCSLKYNDDLCRVCGDGGNLLLCDGCPRSFHQECIDEPSIPQGKWYCRYCESSWKFDAENANALAAGRVTGVDPIEQITKRCIRIVKNPVKSEHISCVLCSSSDFKRGVFSDQTVIVCDQCEKEFHIGCLRAHNIADLKALPKGNWFCCMDCERIHGILMKLVTRGPEELPSGLTGLIKKQEDDNGLNMKWMLLSGKNACRENKPLLSKAVDIFHERFDPIIDVSSGRDFIQAMVYGRRIWGQDFAGMLCAILTVNSNIVTAGMLRVFGEEIAELPIVATSKSSEGKGYFQVLFGCIERLLSSLSIKKIVLPAAEEAKSIWTEKFGFETIPPDELNHLRQTWSAMMTFKGTSMLHKEVPKPQPELLDQCFAI